MAKVLIVDDDPAIRNVLSELLRTLGHEAIACGTLEQGLTTVQDRKSTRLNSIHRT